MKHRFRIVAASAPLLVVSFPGCGDYDPETRASTGGSSTTTGGLNPDNSMATGGAGGSAPSAGTGGSSEGVSAAGSSVGGASSARVEASCDSVTPCGGDLVGTWVAAGSCLPVSGEANMAGFGLGCTAAPITGALEVTGTWSANVDGTFTDQTTTSGNSEIQLPPECLNVSGTTTTCDRLDGALQALGYAAVTCADAASGGCTCAASVQQMGGMAFVAVGAPTRGAYTTANNVLAITGRTPREYAYCVSGGTLSMTPQGMNITGALMGTIVLQKQ